MFSPQPQFSAAAAAPVSSHHSLSARSLMANEADSDGGWLTGVNLRPPSLQQLHSLLAMPSGMLSAGSARGKKKGRGKKVALAREGQIISQMFDALGRRPQPTNGLSLEQSISMEMEVVLPITITSSVTAGIPTFYGLVFAISNFNAASTVLTVFDQYMFQQLETWFEFPNPNAAQDFPELITAVDLDDGNTPTSVGQITDHQGAITASGPAGHYHRWKPHIAVASYSGAFTSYTNAPATWIDSASPNVQHFGLKAACVSNGDVLTVSVVVRAVVCFRAPAIN